MYKYMGFPEGSAGKEHQASLSITSSRSLLKLLPIESVMPSNHLFHCCPLLLPSSVIPSIWVSSNESVFCIRWPKYWSLSFSIHPSNEYWAVIRTMSSCLGVCAQKLLSVYETHGVCLWGGFWGLRVGGSWALCSLSWCWNIFTRYTLLSYS